MNICKVITHAVTSSHIQRDNKDMPCKQRDSYHVRFVQTIAEIFHLSSDPRCISRWHQMHCHKLPLAAHTFSP